MSIILSIETSTPVCSTAVLKDGKVLGVRDINVEKSHSSLLTVLIEELLNEHHLQLKNINAIALSKGPGSYTGLRIGTSTAKGLCFALDIPLIAINTLTAMAKHAINMQKENALYCPMIDARRMEVYTALYDNTLNKVITTKPLVIDEDSFNKHLQENKIYFFGNGAEKCKGIISHPNAVFLDKITPTSKTIGELAQEKYDKADFEDVAYFEPFYLKEFMTKKPKPKF